MTSIVVFGLSSADWQDWIDRFPAVPSSSIYDLEWTCSRMSGLIGGIPKPYYLNTHDRSALRDYLQDYRMALDRSLRRREPIVEAADLVNLGSIAIGLAAAPLVPILTFGALTISLGLFGHKILQRREQERAEMIADKIRAQLSNLERALRP